ncbi:hypothetical protein CYLTODRAFT_419547 [Cylindrobasidium torrendii FP15055 ss-10]|uniref:DUF6534 domain-containing protein n=1 Tax=Cylindrobasidium torrendii FP15055 ss-10 TaxID=1314674 RepID=A0A0D7BJM5_9AGAR|nr:hypothetical protein CYLTODRAFT_419547 [Cylindrobasidium torrendii FP15055 ss-10]
MSAATSAASNATAGDAGAAAAAAAAIVGLPQPWGFFLIGIFISLVLFGIIVAQTWNYFNSFPEDSKWLKLYVGAVFIVDFLSSFFVLWWIYHLLIENWGNIQPYMMLHWALAADPLLEGLIGPMVQAYYAWRIYVISGTWWVSALVLSCSMMAFGGGIAACHAAATLTTFAELINVKVTVIFWLLPAAISDVIIALALTYYLRQHKGRFQGSDKVLDKIIHMTVQNGLLTALTAVVDIILYFTVATPYHIAFTFVLPKLYANTVLSSLCSRASIRRDMDLSNTKQSDPQTYSASAVQGFRTERSQGVVVTVETHELQEAKAYGVDWDSQRSADTKV